VGLDLTIPLPLQGATSIVANHPSVSKSYPDMLQDPFGPPQVAAVLILLQRGLEEAYSQRNTRLLLKEGAHEVGRAFYPVVAVTHLSWIASIAFLIPASAPLTAPVLGAFLALQPMRYWIIATLGRYWTHRIISLPGAPLVTHGPYRILRHPNYALTLGECLLLPLAFEQPALAVIFTVLWAAVLRYKVILEDQALAARRGSEAAPR
jgi:methyltransferase